MQHVEYLLPIVIYANVDTLSHSPDLQTNDAMRRHQHNLHFQLRLPDWHYRSPNCENHEPIGSDWHQVVLEILVRVKLHEVDLHHRFVILTQDHPLQEFVRQY